MIVNWIRLACSGQVVWRAIKVAALVGPILVAVNQGDVILRRELSAACFLKMGLTFLVPYLVSTFSSVAAMKDCLRDDP